MIYVYNEINSTVYIWLPDRLRIIQIFYSKFNFYAQPTTSSLTNNANQDETITQCKLIV